MKLLIHCNNAGIVVAQIALLFVFGLQLNAQKVEYNEMGDKIVVFEDGTWRPYTTADSSLIPKRKTDGDIYWDTEELDDSIFEIPSGQTINEKQIQKKRILVAQEGPYAVLEKKYRRFLLDPSIPEAELIAMQAELQRLKELDESGLANDWLRKRDSLQHYFNEHPHRIDEPTLESCQFKYSVKDEFNKKVIRQSMPALWFQFTDPRLRSQFTDREYLNVYIQAQRDGSDYALELVWEFTNMAAKREYGTISKDASLSILLMNGQIIQLKAKEEHSGDLNPQRDIAYYKVKYPLSSSAIKALSNQEVDKVRMLWSSGYEDYEVYRVALVKEKINCLKKN